MQTTSKLFGFLPANSDERSQPSVSRLEAAVQRSTHAASQHEDPSSSNIHDWTIYDADFFALPWHNENDHGLQDFLQPGTYTLDGASIADIPLFPMYDQHAGG
jgi:hypothetical protein